MPLTPLESGLNHHQLGQLARAAELYREVLAAEPRNADAHHLLGLIALDEGRPAEAIEHIAAAVEISPTLAPFHHHLGAAYRAAGRHEEALASFRRSLGLEPSAAVHNETGALLDQLGKTTEAEASFRQALVGDPRHLEASNNLGNLLERQHRLNEAVGVFSRATEFWPGVAVLHFNLANCHKALQQFSQAATAYRRAVALMPELAAGHHNLGIALQAEKEYTAAIAAHREAIRLKPEFVEAYTALGLAQQAAGKLDDAVASYRQALALKPEDATSLYGLATALQAQRHIDEALALYEKCAQQMADSPKLHFNWGKCSQVQGNFKAAIEHYHRAIALDADYGDAHYFLGTALLAQGQFAAGWPEYEWRLRTDFATHNLIEPLWDGRKLRGERVFIYPEWGFGDTLQFVRYVPQVQERGAEVVLCVQPAMIPLLEESGFTGLIPTTSPPPKPCQWRVPLLSLPRIFGTTLESIPAGVPYLKASPELVTLWRGKLSAWPGFKVAIHWGGSPAAKADGRWVPLEMFEPLANIPGVTLISLQKNEGADELAGVRSRFKVVDFAADLDELHGPFMDTAALVQAVDLVISCDSSVAHLAGALGVDAWIALVKAAEWRWLENREDSPWYPTLRLFRQKTLDDWNDVIERMAEQLKKVMTSGRST